MAHGLTKTLNKHTGLRRVPALSEETLCKLEEYLGTNEAGRWNAIEANHESLRHTIAMPSWDWKEATGEA